LTGHRHQEGSTFLTQIKQFSARERKSAHPPFVLLKGKKTLSNPASRSKKKTHKKKQKKFLQ
jgi:hypothetical protein